MNKYASGFEEILGAYLNTVRFRPEVLDESFRYLLLNGGKRIRPVLLFACAHMLGGHEQDVGGLAVALEMLHTYSLIHDDLPCMDNDGIRRGRPASHVRFGEGQAVLAGDALLNEAHTILLREAENGRSYLAAAQYISENAGPRGMIAGQAADLYYEKAEETDRRVTEFIVLNKTARMMMSAAAVPAIVYGLDDNIVTLFSEYGRNFGYLFQITDDILDVTGTEEEIGKTPGKDSAAAKSGFVRLYGIEKVSEAADKYLASCLTILDEIPYESEFLKTLTRQVRARRN